MKPWADDLKLPVPTGSNPTYSSYLNRIDRQKCPPANPKIVMEALFPP